MEKILKDLNPSQLEAVQQIDGPILILAGAGSGKTKTITSRLAYLISEVGIPPGNTLTLTFTNKAAFEMRERALNMIQNSVHPPLLCTFHKFGLLFLKFHMDRLERKNNFVLIDMDDKRRILKNIDDDLPPALVDNEISRYKNSIISPEEAIAKAEQKNYKLIASIYEKYEKFLREKNMVDFDDLLMLSYSILHKHDDLRKEISEKYNYIMVDEYQDTNDLQYRLLTKLCDTHRNLCVVGDDDQSIYGWRGANIKNILEFPDHFNDTKVIKLEENYRSTPQILKAANELIDHNRNRLGKTLRSTKDDGKDILVYESKDETEEAHKISKHILELIDSGVNPQEIAILFRLNALSRSIEEGLNRTKIPYKLVGAVRFYERAEIKDIMSYFRLVLNLHDDFSLKRVINKPKRGIGKATVDKIEKKAYEQDLSMYGLIDSLSSADLQDLAGKKNARTLKEYFETLNDLKSILDESTMQFLDAFESKIGLKESYNNAPDSIDRVSNIDELYGLYRDYIIQNPMAGMEDFLNEVSLQSDQDMLDGESISAMSIHASKGLEFSYVFVIGMEEGFFPMIRDGSDLEEERRLGYVAYTRAKKELILCHAHSRYYKGKRTDLAKSRFLKESGVIKGSLMIEKTTAFKKGDLVKHKIFGMGRIEAVSKAGKDHKLKINFGGMKREILASFVEKI